jgi:hypothetical protein
MHEYHPFTFTHNVAYQGPWMLSARSRTQSQYKRTIFCYLRFFPPLISSPSFSPPPPLHSFSLPCAFLLFPLRSQPPVHATSLPGAVLYT